MDTIPNSDRATYEALTPAQIDALRIYSAWPRHRADTTDDFHFGDWANDWAQEDRAKVRHLLLSGEDPDAVVRLMALDLRTLIDEHNTETAERMRMPDPPLTLMDADDYYCDMVEDAARAILANVSMCPHLSSGRAA